MKEQIHYHTIGTYYHTSWEYYDYKLGSEKDGLGYGKYHKSCPECGAKITQKIIEIQEGM